MLQVSEKGNPRARLMILSARRIVSCPADGEIRAQSLLPSDNACQIRECRSFRQKASGFFFPPSIRPLVFCSDCSSVESECRGVAESVRCIDLTHIHTYIRAAYYSPVFDRPSVSSSVPPAPLIPRLGRLIQYLYSPVRRNTRDRAMHLVS